MAISRTMPDSDPFSGASEAFEREQKPQTNRKTPTLRPTGYYVLVKVRTVEKEITEGDLAGFQLYSNDEHNREQKGHDLGEVIAIGPLAHMGFDGCQGSNAEERAAEWGYKIGDTVEFARYEGKLLEHPDYPNHRIIPDDKIIAVVEA